MQPSVVSFSTAPLKDVRNSFMGDVEGMLTILLKKQIVSESVDQVCMCMYSVRVYPFVYITSLSLQ